MVVVPAVPRVVQFCTSLGNASKVCTETSFCTSLWAWLPAIVHSSALDRRVTALSSGSRSRQSFLKCDQHSFLPQLSPQRACGYVPRGQWALLDADMPELIDRSACLVEPVVVESLCSSRACLCCPRTEHVQRRVRSLLANVPHPRGLVEGLLLPELLLLSCSRRSCHEESVCSRSHTVLCTLSPW